MAMPLVSVIIPNYNHAPYLEKRIESVLNQTFQDFELILMDDCSTDNSRAVLEKYIHHPKVSKVLFNETNSGSTFKQWNKGIGEAKGEYIWIAESDDFADLNLLESLVNNLDQYLKAGVAYCQSWHVDENETVLGTWEVYTHQLDEKKWAQDFCMNGREAIRQYHIFKTIIPNASAALIRKSVYEKAGYADETYRLNGDWILWARLFLVADVVFVAKPLNYFRTHKQNVRSATIQKGVNLVEYLRGVKFITSSIDIPEEIFDIALSRFLNLWFNSIIRYQIPLKTNFAIFRLFWHVDPKAKRKILKKIAREKWNNFRMLFWLLYNWAD